MELPWKCRWCIKIFVKSILAAIYIKLNLFFSDQIIVVGKREEQVPKVKASTEERKVAQVKTENVFFLILHLETNFII